jgi:hypothetical protein
MESIQIGFRRVVRVGLLTVLFALTACSDSTGEDWNGRVAERTRTVASLDTEALGARVVDCKSSSLVGRGSDFASPVGSAPVACWEWASADPRDAIESATDAIQVALPAMPRQTALPTSCTPGGSTGLAFLPTACYAAILDPSSPGSYFLVIVVPDYDEAGYIRQLFDERKSLGYVSEELMEAIPDVRVEIAIFYLDPYEMTATPTS